MDEGKVVMEGTPRQIFSRVEELKQLRLDVPQVTELCRSAAEKVIKKPVKVVGPGVKTGLNIKLDDPATAGSDLVVVAVAALNEYTCPQIVIDMGTATTMSVLDQKGSSSEA